MTRVFEDLSSILPRIFFNDVVTSGVISEELSQIKDLAVDEHPHVIFLLPVLGHNVVHFQFFSVDLAECRLVFSSLVCHFNL